MKLGHKYEFKSISNNFYVDIIESGLFFINTRGVIRASVNPNYKVGSEFIIDSPLTIRYREVYPKLSVWIPSSGFDEIEPRNKILDEQIA